MNKNSDENSAESKSSWLVIFSLIFAGEMIFSLPFHVARFFRPSLLDTFSLTNSDLGDTFAFYGITAMVCYFPGGVVADNFSARRLLTFSLISTAIGGFFFAQIPQGTSLMLLYGYWGITTILLFWAGMIKATREWGGLDKQGRAFGLLDGGRGLAAALMSSIAVVLFASHIQSGEAPEVASDSLDGLRSVIYFYTLMTFVAAILVWKLIPDTDPHDGPKLHPWNGMLDSMRSSKVWLQAVIIICAYCGYKGADNYGLYAVQVLSMDQVDSAAFTSIAAYLRPVGAICAGLIADRFSAGRVIAWCFTLLAILYAILSVSWPASILFNLAMFNLLVSFLAVFALRGVYFALVQESKIKHYVTGTAVGFISLIGYTPDIFFAAISGRILDAAPGVEGFENYFVMLMGISILGMLASVLLNRANQNQSNQKLRSPDSTCT
jgi:nitrate/nitrite transporter NarK